MKGIIYQGMELLPPKSDLVFKALFGMEGDKEPLRCFLEAMLGIEIENFDFFNSELPAGYVEGKTCRLDLRVRTLKGENIHVEVQLTDDGNIVQRTIGYNAALIASQMGRGHDYKDMGKSISLVIVDFLLFKDAGTWYNNYIITNSETGEALTDLVQYVFVELPKLAVLENGIEMRDSLNAKERWALFLAAKRGETLDAISKNDPMMERAVRKLAYISEDEKIRFMWEMRERAEIDAYNHDLAVKRRAEKEGMEKGIAKGMEKKALEVAGRLKSIGLCDEAIVEAVGLPLEVVRSLRPGQGE